MREDEYFDLEKEFNNWKPFIVNKKNVKANKGKTIAYVNSRSIDKYRGYYSIDYVELNSTYYSTLLIDNGHDSVDMRDIVSCIMKND